MRQLILILILVNLALWGCTQSRKILVYDFKNNNFSPETGQNISAKDYLLIRIVNVNPFLYDVEVKGEAIKYDFPMPDVFKASMITFETPELKQSATPQPNGERGTGGQEAKKAQRINEIAGEMTTRLNKLKETSAHFNDIKTLYERLMMLVAVDNIDTVRLVDQKKQLLSIYSITCDDVNNGCTFSILQEFNKRKAEVNQSAEALLTYYNINLDQNEKALFFDKYVEVREFQSAFKKENYDEYLHNLLKLYSSINSEAFKVEKMYSGFEDQDEVKLSFSITPKKDLKYTDPRKEAIDFTKQFSIRQGFKINFSTGVVGINLKDDTFSTRFTIAEGDTVQQSVIYRNDAGRFDLGIGAMAHAYWVLGEFINPAFSFGAMVSSAGKIRYLAGVSGILGKQNRVIISSGLTVGKVDRLVRGLSEGDVIQNLDELKTHEQTKAGWFIGLTYNLSGK